VSRNLPSVFWQIKRVRGQSSEERVDNALQFLLEQGKIGSFQSSDELDGEGIEESRESVASRILGMMENLERRFREND